MDFNKLEFSILDSFPQCILIIDENLNIYYNNKKFKHIEGKNLSKSLNKKNTSFIYQSIKDINESASKIAVQQYEDNFYYLEITISIFSEGYYNITIKDVTKTHRSSIIQKCCFTISEAIYNSNDLETLYKEIHLAVTEITNTDNFYISTVDWSKNEIDFPYYIDKHDTVPNTRNFKNGLTEHVINSGESVLLDNTTYDNFIKINNIKIRGKKSYNWLGVPLKLNNNKTVGMIGIQSYKNYNKLTTDDLNLLNMVSNQIATAIKRKKDDIYIHKQAHYDALTGLTNKALFYDRLDHAILQAQRHDEVIGVLFLDIDDFKNINDTMGHSIGDELLKIIAEIIKVSVRKSDTVARWGGDEFCVLLPSVKDNDGVIKLCDRILTKNFRNIKLNDKRININASIGISFYPMNGKDAESLIDNADKSMYKAKQNGKNQFRVYSEE
tara:strand:- start:2030 stop:3349 length:1320 start_codon:yes stop_codon:yes gene_type:complete